MVTLIYIFKIHFSNSITITINSLIAFQISNINIKYHFCTVITYLENNILFKTMPCLKKGGCYRFLKRGPYGFK